MSAKLPGKGSKNQLARWSGVGVAKRTVMNGLHVAAPLDVQTAQANIAQKAVNHPISNVYCAKSRTELVLPNVEGKLGVLISSKLAFPRRIVHPLV